MFPGRLEQIKELLHFYLAIRQLRQSRRRSGKESSQAEHFGSAKLYNSSRTGDRVKLCAISAIF